MLLQRNIVQHSYLSVDYRMSGSGSILEAIKASLQSQKSSASAQASVRQGLTSSGYIKTGEVDINQRASRIRDILNGTKNMLMRHELYEKYTDVESLVVEETKNGVWIKVNPLYEWNAKLHGQMVSEICSKTLDAIQNGFNLSAKFVVIVELPTKLSNLFCLVMSEYGYGYIPLQEYTISQELLRLMKTKLKGEFTTLRKWSVTFTPSYRFCQDIYHFTNFIALDSDSERNSYLSQEIVNHFDRKNIDHLQQAALVFWKYINQSIGWQQTRQTNDLLSLMMADKNGNVEFRWGMFYSGGFGGFFSRGNKDVHVPKLAEFFKKINQRAFYLGAPWEIKSGMTLYYRAPKEEVNESNKHTFASITFNQESVRGGGKKKRGRGYEAMTKAELIKRAAARGIKGVKSRMRKADIIAVMRRRKL